MVPISASISFRVKDPKQYNETVVWLLQYHHRFEFEMTLEEHSEVYILTVYDVYTVEKMQDLLEVIKKSDVEV